METIVTTLPIAPKRTPAVGTFLGSFAARVIAARNGSRFLVPTNIVGAKGYTRDDANVFHAHASAIVGGAPRRWVDADIAWPSAFGDVLAMLQRRGDAVSARTAVRVCPCGITEHLASITPQGRGARSEDGVARCAVCGQATETRERDCLLIRLRAPEAAIAAEPRYCATDLRSHFAEWDGRWLLADRIRETGINASFAGVKRHLDPDLCWMSMPWVLHVQRMRVGTLVTGVRTLRQSALAVMLSAQLGADVPEVAAVPFLSGPPVGALDLPAPAVRILLAMAGGAEAKDVTLDARDMEMAVRAVRLVSAHAPRAVDASPDLRSFKKPRITSLVAAIRKGNALSVDEARLASMLR